MLGPALVVGFATSGAMHATNVLVLHVLYDGVKGALQAHLGRTSRPSPEDEPKIFLRTVPYITQTSQ